MLQANAKSAKPGSLLKKPGVCERLSISPRTLNYRIANNEIPYVKLPGGAVRFIESDIEALIASHRIPARKQRKNQISNGDSRGDP
jgi:excisionase family DNA binding protein